MLLFLGLACYAMAHAYKTIYQAADSVTVEKLLTKAKKMPRDTNFMLHFGREFIGVPYVGHTLDKDLEENLVVNLRQLDCTTYVETVLALSLCAQNGETRFADYCRHLRELRYVDGEVAYTKRQHYFVYWMDANKRQGIVSVPDVSKAAGAKTRRLKVNYMSTHQSAYKMLAAHPEWMPEIKKMEKAIDGREEYYIPKTALNDTKQLRQLIKDGDIIVIMTSIDGLDTSHIGMAVWHKDGLHMLNASSVHKKVVEETMLLSVYMSKHPKQLGIKTVRVSKSL